MFNITAANISPAFLSVSIFAEHHTFTTVSTAGNMSKETFLSITFMSAFCSHLFQGGKVLLFRYNGRMCIFDYNLLFRFNCFSFFG